MWITADDSQCPIHHAPIPPERILSTLLIQFLLSDEHRQADFDEKDDRKWLVGWLTAGFFALLAVIVSATLIALHLKNWSRPPLQKHIARILFMVPSYAVCAFVSYRFPDAAIYINLYRDVYEGFAVYSFFNLCLLYLGHTWDEQRESMMASSGSTIRRFPPPMCCFRYDPKHPRFLMYCKLGICQLVILRLFTSTFTIVLEMMGLFCPESMSWRFGHFWAVLFNFTGMGLSMFTLLSFYLAVHHDLPPGRPIYQFLAIKFVLFISYLQTFTLTLLVSVGVIKGNENWTPAEVINAIASFLTCFEMFGAAVLNVFAFSWREFRVVGSVSSPLVEPHQQGVNGRLSTGVYGVLDGGISRYTVVDAILDAARPDDLWKDAVLTFGLVLSLLGWRKAEPEHFTGYDDEDYQDGEDGALLSHNNSTNGNR